MSRSRAQLAGLLLVLVAASGCKAERPARPTGEPGPAPTAAVAAGPDGRPAELRRASSVLHRWHQARRSAYARGDRDALRRLYVPGSAAGEADLRLLRAYDDRGLRVRRLTTQVLRIRVLDLGRGRIVLAVRDRATGTAVSADRPGRRIRLPTSAPADRVLTFRRLDRWRLARADAGTS